MVYNLLKQECTKCSFLHECNVTAAAVLLQWCTDLCLILPGLGIYYVQVVHLFTGIYLCY
jgi:hypothetical protein